MRIMGLDHPAGGQVTVNGCPYHDLRWPLREVGALLEAKAIHPGRPAWAHLWMLAQTNDIPRRRVDEVIAMVGLDSAARQRAGGSPWAWASASASPPRCWATPAC